MTKIKLISQAGGRLTKNWYPWVKAMYKDGKTLHVIASYFSPRPSIITLRRIIHG